MQRQTELKRSGGTDEEIKSEIKIITVLLMMTVFFIDRLKWEY